MSPGGRSPRPIPVEVSEWRDRRYADPLEAFPPEDIPQPSDLATRHLEIDKEVWHSPAASVPVPCDAHDPDPAPGLVKPRASALLVGGAAPRAVKMSMAFTALATHVGERANLAWHDIAHSARWPAWKSSLVNLKPSLTMMRLEAGTVGIVGVGVCLAFALGVAISEPRPLDYLASAAFDSTFLSDLVLAPEPTVVDSFEPQSSASLMLRVTHDGVVSLVGPDTARSSDGAADYEPAAPPPVRAIPTAAKPVPTAVNPVPPAVRAVPTIAKAVPTTARAVPMIAKTVVARDSISTPRPVGSSGKAAFIGGLAIQSDPPGATVFVNQLPVGETPLRLTGLSAGSRVVRIEHVGYERWTAAVLVAADKQAMVSARLQASR